MSVCVQPVMLPGGDKTWTVLGVDHRPVGPVEEFLEYQRVTGSSPHTVRAYAKALQLWWRYLELDGRGWAGADVPALAGFVSWLRQGTPPGVLLLDPVAAERARLSESTLATRLAAVVSFYRYHHDAHQVAPALARAWSGPARRGRYRAFLAHLDGRSRTSRRGPMPMRPRRRELCPLLTPAQVAAILAACAMRDPASGEWSGSLRNRLLFATLAETGMRLGEVLCLTHADWHPGSGGTPFIQVVPRDHPRRARVKGGRGRRIYVSDELERLYGDYLWELAERAGRAGHEVSDEWFCFVNLDGEPRFAPLRPESVYKVLDRLRRELPGLPRRWSPHWLRHTHASALLLAGVPLHVVSRRLGHADVQTTMDLYGWVSEDAELRAVAGWRSFTEGWRVTDA
jgi:site-specific recombinase XerD